MAPRILIAGATGVFGRRLASRLVEATDAQLLVGSRAEARAARVCEGLASPRATPVALDLGSRRSFERAAGGCTAVVCAAGPFQDLPRALPRWAAGLGAHWLDIADDPGWVLGQLDDEGARADAAANGATIAPGLSTTPAVSGAMIEQACRALPDVRSLRVCLFIGNRNAKGPALLRSAVAHRLRPAGRARLPISGSRLLFACPSADDALARRRLGIPAPFFVAPEFAVGARAMRFAPEGRTAGRVLAALASVVSVAGTARGAVEVEAAGEAGSVVAGVSGGQGLAIEPCVTAVRAVLEGRVAAGVHPPAEVTPADELARWLTARGFDVAAPRPGRWGA